MFRALRSVFLDNNFRLGSFLRGSITGASITFGAAMFIMQSNPLYVVEMAFDGISEAGLSKGAQTRIMSASGRFLEALVLAEENHVALDVDEPTVAG